MTPLSLLALPSVLAFFNLGPTEMVILLIIVLILFGGSRLPALMRGMADGIHNFKDGMRQDEVWQFNDGQQRQLNEAPKTDQNQHWIVWLVLGAAAPMLIAAGIEGEISTKQMLVALGVLIVCALAWWFCFRKGRD
jgi:sec-independent protein translocase protein TatA